MANDNYLLKSLDIIMADRFGRYSKYIIQQRALPDARDGLKPVQRRILYSMWELGLKAEKPFKKSARVVGDVIGKYHPHGDSSIYEAMVRMGQEWKMNVPLIEMHGNKGSIDDDPAAAMRYTETRLEKITALMLEGIEKKIVTFAPNFDDSEQEPTVLPALIPNLLINGARGIASGFATEIPPHNLGEVLEAAIAKIKNPAITLNSLMKYIQGPDFPTGGIINGNKGIYEAFERGQGRITLASKYTIKREGNKHFIEITQIPFGVIKSKLVRDIDEIRFEKKVPGIKEVLDQTNRDGILILIELEIDANAQVIANYLLQKTEMQVYYSYNSIAIKDYAPHLMTLQDLLNAYLEHLKKIKQQELAYDLGKFENKLEIIQGLIRVSDITDAVIEVIKSSDNSKKGVILALQQHFNFSEVQATAIAELRLYRLSRFDQVVLLQEAEQLQQKITTNKLLLSDPASFNDYLILLLKNIKTQFATPRKTLINEADLKIEINTQLLIKSEEIYVGISQNGYIKMFSNRVFEANTLTNYALKEGDKIIFLHQVNTLDKLLIFNSKGSYVFINVHKIIEQKWRDLGVHINDFAVIPSNARIVSVINVKNFDTNAYATLVTKHGLAKRVAIANFETSRFSRAITAIKFKQSNDELINVKLSNGYQDIVILSNSGRIVRFSENEIPIYNTNSSGVKVMSLYEKDSIINFMVGNSKDVFLIGTNLSKFKKMHFSSLVYSSKGSLGKALFTQSKTHPIEVEIFEVIDIEAKVWCYTVENQIHEFAIKEMNYSKNEEGFSKVKIAQTKMISFNAKRFVSSSDPFWVVKNVQEEQQTITNSNNIIDKKFEEIADKIKSLDDLNIDDLLKKIK